MVEGVCDPTKEGAKYRVVVTRGRSQDREPVRPGEVELLMSRQRRRKHRCRGPESYHDPCTPLIYPLLSFPKDSRLEEGKGTLYSVTNPSR